MMPADPNNKPLMHARNHTPSDQTPVPSPLALTGAMPQGIPYSGGPAGMTPTPTVSTLMLALKRRCLLAGTLALIGAVLAVAAVAVVFPPKYVAQTRLELQSRSRPIISQGMGETESDPAIYRASQQAIIKSPLVLSRALNSDKLKGLKISGQSVEALEHAIKADFAQGPEIMTVKLSGDQPDNLGDMLNAIVQAYIKEVEGRDTKRKTLLIDQLEQSKRDHERKLDEKRRELFNTEQAQRIPDQRVVDDRRRMAAGKVQSVSELLRHTRNDLSIKKLDKDALKARLEKIADEPISKSDLRKAIADAQALNSRLVTNLKPYLDYQNAIDAEMVLWQRQLPSAQQQKALQDLTQQKKTAQANIDLEVAKIQVELEKEIRGDRQDKLENELGLLEKTVKRLEVNEHSLQLELEKAQSELEGFNVGNLKVGVNVYKLRDDEEQIKDVLKMLAKDVALLKAEPATASRVVVLQPAETPTDKDYSRLIKLGGAAGFGTFGLILFGVAFLEFRLRKVNSVDEVTQGLGMNLVGTMPRLPLRVRQPVPGGPATDNYWQSIITESVDAIRTQLLHASRTDAVHVVMVTSANGGEGKTSLATQLAASLARAWRKTLLVDGDLRSPAAHKLFDLPLEPGFSEVLRGEANLADVVKPTQLSRLWLMPAGHWDAHAVQALAQDTVRSMFDQLKEQYDFIIVDSSPVLPVADSLLLAQHVDGVIFSVLREVSRMPSVHAAQQKLQGLGVRSLGAVVIGANNDGSNNGYAYAGQAGS